MDAVNTVIFAGAVIADVMLLASLIMAVTLGVSSLKTRAGRITFGSIVTLKLWVFLTLTYINIAPFIVPYLPPEVRVGIRAFLTLYLLVQALGVIIALYKWRHD